MLQIAVSTKGNNLKWSRKYRTIERRKRVGGENWERLWVGDFLPFYPCSMHFSPSLSLLLFSLFFCNWEDADHTWGVVLPTAVRRSAVTTHTGISKVITMLSSLSPLSDPFTAFAGLNISARQSEVCVIYHIKPGSAPITTQRLAPSTCAGIHLCTRARSYRHSGVSPSRTEAASWKHKVLHRGTPALWCTVRALSCPMNVKCVLRKVVRYVKHPAFSLFCYILLHICSKLSPHSLQLSRVSCLLLISWHFWISTLAKASERRFFEDVYFW